MIFAVVIWPPALELHVVADQSGSPPNLRRRSILRDEIKLPGKPGMVPSCSDIPAFEHLYGAVDRALCQSLRDFRSHYTPKEWFHAGVTWQYVTLGKGQTGALFLPGAAGAYDIWWQQLLDLTDDLHLISISYPPAGSLELLRAGLNAIMQHEGMGRFHVIGSSMGGYVAQYLASTQPDSLLSATFANTFGPMQPGLRLASLLRYAISVLPLPLFRSAYRALSRRRLVPAGGHSPLLEAYSMEASYAGLSRADLLARLRCVMQPFIPYQDRKRHFPILLLDSENDPLIRPGIRKTLRETYPSARLHTFARAGHFPYLSHAELFTSVLRSFLLVA